MPSVRWPIGYVRGALEHAAVAWLPAAAPSHVNLLERGLREAAASSPVSALNTVPRTNGGSPTFSDGGEKLDAGCQAAGEGAGSAIRGPPARDRQGLGTGAPVFGPRLEIARPPGLGESENPTVSTDGWRHLPVGRVPDPGWGHGGGKGKRGYAAPRVPAPVCCPALDGRICGGRSLQVLGGSRAGLAVFVFVFVFTFKSDPHTKCVAITAQNPYPRLLI